MAVPTVIAIDWSGAKVPKGIWLTQRDGGEQVDSRPLRSREDAVERVLRQPTPVIVGFDFSFSLPYWFVADEGCATIDDVWTLAAEKGEEWLRPTPPFWKAKNANPPQGRRFRRCETRFPGAKSVFQLVGNGQVGPGSVRGMPLLALLRAEGFAIWPFDSAGPRTVIEIYPTVLRPLAPDDLGPFGTDDEHDAVCSAFVMAQHADEIMRLPRATDPITRLEGDVWMPGATCS